MSLSRGEAAPCVPTNSGSSRAREPLYLYIAAASEAVSMVLVTERAAQQPRGVNKSHRRRWWSDHHDVDGRPGG
jgi:hypothetical protein